MKFKRSIKIKEFETFNQFIQKKKKKKIEKRCSSFHLSTKKKREREKEKKNNFSRQTQEIKSNDIKNER